MEGTADENKNTNLNRLENGLACLDGLEIGL